jgi:hypothetical protein
VRRTLLVMAAAALMAMMLVAMAAPAFAYIGSAEHNPKHDTTPAADVWTNEGDEAGYIYTYKPPVADGGDPPKGGSPGKKVPYEKAFCLKHSDSC